MLNFYYGNVLYTLRLDWRDRLQIHYRRYLAKLQAASFVRKLLTGLFQGPLRTIRTAFLAHSELKELMDFLEYVEGMGHAPFSVNCSYFTDFLCSALWPFGWRCQLHRILEQPYRELYSFHRFPFVSCIRVWTCIIVVHMNHSLSFHFLCFRYLVDSFVDHLLYPGWPGESEKQVVHVGGYIGLEH